MNGIREIRERVGMTQQELAEKIGVATRTISRYETGERKPDVEKMNQIAFCLGVKSEELFSEEKKCEQEEKKMVEKEVMKVEEKIQEKVERGNQKMMCPFRTFTRKHEDGYSAQKFSECLYGSCAMYRGGECKMGV